MADVVTPGYVHDDIATVTTLNGPDSLSINLLDQTPTVTNTTTFINVGPKNFNYTFPAHSVTLIQVGRAAF